jgi:cytosine/adenosine deaminase-related metal-dependent hydrolase
MSILIKNPRLACRMNSDWKDGGDLLESFSGGHIYIEDNQIISAGSEPFTGHADTTIDASRMVVLPGLVNTHHHFFQTLTRNVLAAQDSELFDWLITHYEIWPAAPPVRTICISSPVKQKQFSLTGKLKQPVNWESVSSLPGVPCP